MNNKPIEYSKSCTYLGLKIDSKLAWKEHIDEKISKCKRFLMKTVHETRANFGPKPKLMKWGFTGMVSPVLTYGAYYKQQNNTRKIAKIKQASM